MAPMPGTNTVVVVGIVVSSGVVDSSVVVSVIGVVLGSGLGGVNVLGSTVGILPSKNGNLTSNSNV